MLIALLPFGQVAQQPMQVIDESSAQLFVEPEKVWVHVPQFSFGRDIITIQIYRY